MKRDYIEFQDRSWPKAFLISFRCYGTWLHGDKRGSVDRKGRNIFGTPKCAPNRNLENFEFGSLKQPPVKLTSLMRRIVESTIKEVCQFRGYRLIAVNVRTNHVHTVVSANAKPERIMNAFKAYSTRRLREAGSIQRDQRTWARHGSTRYLWKERHIEIATGYVLNGQGVDLPDFD